MPVFPRSLSDRLAERYEDLRRQAQGEFGNRAGMVVFLRQGMTAWMVAWSKWATSEPIETAADRVESADTLPLTLRGEITLVLAGMALCGDSFRPSQTARGRSFQNMEAITV